jgi:hypothetical protein
VAARTTSTLSVLKSLQIVIAGLFLASCTSMPPISTDIEYCCQAGTDSIHTYRIEFKDMPEFLKPMLRDELSLVLDSKGLEYTEGTAHAVITMTFVHRPISTEDESRDDIDGNLSSGGDSRFIAEVDVEMTKSVTSERVLAGSMSRFHNATVGSYMHDSPSRAAMRSAFMNIFADYPISGMDDI